METNVILLAALVCALISGTVIAYVVCNAIRETLRTQKVQSRSGVDGSFISSSLRHGIGAFRSLSQLLITFFLLGYMSKNLSKRFCIQATAQQKRHFFL